MSDKQNQAWQRQEEKLAKLRLELAAAKKQISELTKALEAERNKIKRRQAAQVTGQTLSQDALVQERDTLNAQVGELLNRNTELALERDAALQQIEILERQQGDLINEQTKAVREKVQFWEERDAVITELAALRKLYEELKAIHKEDQRGYDAAITRAEALLNYVQHERDHRGCRYNADDEKPVCTCGLLELLVGK